MGGGLLWARVSTQTGIQFDLNLDKVKYFEDSKAAAETSSDQIQEGELTV